MEKGWICLNRSLLEHWLWQDKPFSRGQAWIDLLLLANHDNNKFLLGNELITLERGEFVTSEVKLMERWGWSKWKTREFLKLLISDNMIVKKTDRKKTTLKIVNYGKFNNLPTIKQPKTDHEPTTNQPQPDTNNNENNDNNENNKREREPLPEIKAPKYPTGKYNNVMLTQEEAAKLSGEFPAEAAGMIEKLSEYMETTGKKYANHYAVICKWIREDREKPKQEPKKNNAALNYTQRQYTDADIAAIERKKLGLQ